MLKPRIALVGFLFLFLAESAVAETILMQNGQTIRGRITNQDRTSVTIETPGGVVVLQKAVIRRIVYDDARFEAEEKKRLEEARKQQEIERKAQDERKRQDDKRAADEKQRLEEKKNQEAARTPSTPREGRFVVRISGSNNIYQSGMFAFYRADRQTYFGTFQIPIFPFGIKEKDNEGFGVAAGYETLFWYVLADGIQIRSHSTFAEAGRDFAGIKDPADPPYIFAVGGAAQQRDAVDGRIGISPVPRSWALRPYAYVGYASFRMMSRYDFTEYTRANTSFRVLYVPGLRSTATGNGLEAGIDLRYTLPLGLEVRGLYGQSWQRGDFIQKGVAYNYAVFGLNLSPNDRIPISILIKGSASIRVKRYEFTLFSPRFGPVRVFTGYREEKSVLRLSNLLPNYLPATQLALLSGNAGPLVPDFAQKGAGSRVTDRYRGYRVGVELAL